MKRYTLYTIVLFLLILFLSAGHSAIANPPNFSGKWILNKAKSILEARMWQKVETITIEINQNKNEITINSILKSEDGESSSSVELTIGGDRVLKEGVGGSSVYMNGYWAENDRNLVIETASSIRTADGSMFNTKITDTYSLARLGTVLYMKREITTPNGSFLSTLLFDAVK